MGCCDECVLYGFRAMIDQLSAEGAEERIGVHRVAYNWAMRAARRRHGFSQAQLGEMVGRSNAYLSQVETLRVYPGADLRRAISVALGLPEEAVFPGWLREFRLKREAVPREEECFFIGDLTGNSLAAAPSLEEAVEADALRESMKKALASLGRIERLTVKFRFGLDGRESSPTLEEVAEELAALGYPRFSQDRIKQILARGLRKLRRPKAARHLRDFL